MIWATCAVRALNVAVLAVMPFVLAAAGACCWQARQYHHRARESAAATHTAGVLTGRIIAHAAPFLECQVCGSTLDPRAGVGVGLDTQGQLQLHCSHHLTASDLGTEPPSS